MILAVALAASAAGLCATPTQAAQISSFYEKLPSAPPLVAHRHMKLPEELIASGIPATYGTGVSGTHFSEVWASLSNWPFGFFIMDQKGWIMKFQAPLPPLLGNVRKDEFVDAKAPGENGLISHLRPDRVTSIYAVALPGGLGRDGKTRDGVTRAVIFYDDSGESVFGVYASLAGEDLPADALASFDVTMALMRTLPQRCVP